MLLGTRLAIKKRNRTEVRARTVGVLATAEGTSHAGFNTVDLLKPGLVKRLGGRNLLSRGRGGRLSLGLRMAIATLTTPRAALALPLQGAREAVEGTGPQAAGRGAVAYVRHEAGAAWQTACPDGKRRSH